MGIKRASVTYICDRCHTQEEISGDGKDGFKPCLGTPVGWETIPTKEHEYLTVCYSCFQKQDDVSKLKVLSFIDTEGRCVVIDVSEPRNRVQVYVDIAASGYAHSNETEVSEAISSANLALSEGVVDNIKLLTIADRLIEALDHVDLDINVGRDGLAPFTPSTGW